MIHQQRMLIYTKNYNKLYLAPGCFSRRKGKQYLYTEAYKSFKIYRREAEKHTSYFGDIRSRYLHIRPSLVDPIFHPLQHLPWDLLIRTDGNKRKNSHRSIILSIDLRTRHIKAVPGTTKYALDDPALLFKRMRRQGEMDFEAVDEHGHFPTF